MTSKISVIKARMIDHAVLPVESLEVARARYEALGFTVAPDAIHPFGTENCCVFLKDGTFLEPLGIASRETCEEQAIKRHSFVKADQTFRFRVSQNGFSQLVFKSDDANADHKAFKKAGFSAGSKVKFSRSYQKPGEEPQTISFKLAFAGDSRAPDAGFFTCEVKRAPKGGRGALVEHENGVTGMRQIMMSEPNPTDFQYMLQTVLNQRDVDANSFGMELEAANGSIAVLSPEGAAAWFGPQAAPKDPHARGLLFQAIVFSVSNMDLLAARLAKQNIEHFMRGTRLIVPPAPGQGTTFAFEEDAT